MHGLSGLSKCSQDHLLAFKFELWTLRAVEPACGAVRAVGRLLQTGSGDTAANSALGLLSPLAIPCSLAPVTALILYWNLMVKQLLTAAKAKAAALGCYLSFAGGLTPELQLHISSAIMHGVMIYGAPVWGGGKNDMGATAGDMNKLAQVWDGVLRSLLGCGSRTLFRAEAALQGVVFVTELNLRRLNYSTQQLGAGKRVRKHVEVAGSVKRVV
jgi:hypothetical protein